MLFEKEKKKKKKKEIRDCTDVIQSCLLMAGY